MKALRITAPTFVLALVVACAFSAFAQTGSDEDVPLPKIHRFQPTGASSRTQTAQQNTESGKSGELSASAIEQINALEDDKEARTPVQRKISSRLIYTARMLQGQAIAPGVPVLFTNVELDEQNNFLVDITANVSDELLKRLGSMGVRIIHSDPAYRSVRAFIPPHQLEAVAGLPEVVFISPRRQAMTRVARMDSSNFLGKPLSASFAERAARLREKISAQLANVNPGVACVSDGQGSAFSEGYKTHRANDACTTYGVTGSGVKIGVLSDGVTSLALSQATNDLGPVTVLAGQTGDGDEGTAMLEIIHDLAPNAQLFFATAFTSITSFAQNIRDLRAAGCDIIVDDVVYFAETPFQDGQAPSVISTSNGGVVTQAINDVVADGAMYFSSAGNESNKDGATSQTFEGDFLDGGTNNLLPGGKVQKFGTTPYNVATATVSGGGLLVLTWTDPLGGSANDYDLYVLNAGGTKIEIGSNDFQTGTQDPVEGGDGRVDVFPGERVVVFKVTSAAKRFLHLAGFGVRFTTATQGAIIGHSGATGAFAVGATPAHLPICGTCPSGPWPDPFDSTNLIEPFSADGPRRIFFEADGTPITPGNFSSTGGTVLQKPEFTAADGVNVTGVGGFGSLFYGTSASAPHAAAIAALVKSHDSTLSNSEIAASMTSSAIDIMGAGTDRDSGAGIVMAFGAVQASTAPNIVSLTPQNGVVSTPITITGKRFGNTQGGSTITFNGTAATPTVWGDTSVTVPVPAGATNGNVVVTVGGLASNGVPFTLTPSITGLSTNLAPAGASVTITGTNFGATKGTSTVKFNGVAASVTTWSMTSLVVTVPTNSTGNIVVTVNGVASNGLAFTMEDFAVPATVPNLTVTAGQSVSETFDLTTSTGFDAPITFACSGLPSKSSCTFAPANPTPGATSPVTVTMTISTTATVPGTASAILGTWLPFGSLGLVLAVGVGSRKRNRKALAGVGLMLAIPVLLTIVSCGGGGSSKIQPVPGTPPGTKTITLRATSGPTSHTATFNLTVQ